MVIDYKNCMVAFIDVMGFKQLLGEKGKKNLEVYFQNLSGILDFKTRLYSGMPEDNFQAIAISDSIILSVVLSEDNGANMLTATRFFTMLSGLQYNLAVKANSWTRGAVSIGELHMEADSRFVVGRAYVNAYELEKSADYPRIVLDPRILKEFGKSPNVFVGEINEISDGDLLIPPTNGVGFDQTGFSTEAMQINWFREAYRNESKLDSFFDDISDRQSHSQELFRKANLLLYYLEYCNSLKRKHRNGPIGPRYVDIEELIKKTK